MVLECEGTTKDLRDGSVTRTVTDNVVTRLEHLSMNSAVGSQLSGVGSSLGR